MPLTPHDLLDWLRDHHRSAHYALGVSGGADSMALLELIGQVARLNEIPRFSVLSVDHGLRAAARAEIQLVADRCKVLALPHVVLTNRQVFATGGIQAAARARRYALVAGWCAEHAADGFLLAHHLHDQAETMLMRLARGSGINGLGGMLARQKLLTPAGSVVLLRPFLTHRPETLRGSLALTKTRWAEDPSNADQRFERVRWRAMLCAAPQNRVLVPALGRLAGDMQKLRTALDRLAVDWLTQHAAWHAYGFIIIDRVAFAVLGEVLQRRILAALIRQIAGRPFAVRQVRLTGFLDRLAAHPAGAMTMSGVLLRWRRGQLMIGRELAALRNLRQPAMGMFLWDGRYFLDFDADLGNQKHQGQFVAPLGVDGLAALKAMGVVPDKSVPAAYLHVLPAVFEGKRLCACPLLRADHARRACLAHDATAFDLIFATS